MQKTAYDMRISDWSSDGCSSDLVLHVLGAGRGPWPASDFQGMVGQVQRQVRRRLGRLSATDICASESPRLGSERRQADAASRHLAGVGQSVAGRKEVPGKTDGSLCRLRSEEHTSELQSLMRIAYADFCLKNKT